MAKGANVTVPHRKQNATGRTLACAPDVSAGLRQGWAATAQSAALPEPCIVSVYNVVTAPTDIRA